MVCCEQWILNAMDWISILLFLDCLIFEVTTICWMQFLLGSATFPIKILQKNPTHPELSDKKYITTCIFQLKSVPASLFKALGSFATNGVNLCKLESFSVKNTFDQVNFYIDIEGHIEEKKLQKSLEELGFHTQKLDILGVYEAHQFRFKD